jgi:hypothetical protein
MASPSDPGQEKGARNPAPRTGLTACARGERSGRWRARSATVNSCSRCRATKRPSTAWCGAAGDAAMGRRHPVRAVHRLPRSPGVVGPNRARLATARAGRGEAGRRRRGRRGGARSERRDPVHPAAMLDPHTVVDSPLDESRSPSTSGSRPAPELKRRPRRWAAGMDAPRSARSAPVRGRSGSW